MDCVFNKNKVGKILEKLQNPELTEEEKEILEKSIEIAFDALQ